jgi:hypothetical protein
MSKNELIEQELDEILEKYHLLSWKELVLEVLSKNEQKEKEHREELYSTSVTNDITRIIEITEALKETEAA